MSERTHTLRPGAAVQSLVPQRGSSATRLEPHTEVLCIHRGQTPYEDMWDSIPFRIEPGYFKTEYAAAKHFQDRAVVPGSRNPETAFQASFIAIIGIVDFNEDGSFRVVHAVDAPEQWEAFSAEEQAEYEGAPEALDRDGMVNPIAAKVDIVSTSSVTAGRPERAEKPSRVKGDANAKPRGGSGKGARVRPDLEVTDPAIMKPIPAEDNPVVREAQAAVGQAEAEGHRSR